MISAASMHAGTALWARGSEWRKWDLHLHAPGTKLADGYGAPADLDRFCRALEASDVDVFGITDYFSADGYLAVAQHYRQIFPNTTKVLLPNIEFRLNETVNGQNQTVHIHLLLRPDVNAETLHKLLSELKTTMTDANGRALRCNELITRTQFAGATVTRKDIEEAINETWGSKASRDENVLIIVPANNDGIRAESGKQRKANLADEIDKLADAIFGNSKNFEWFLQASRYEDRNQISKPKPVFACSDAHSFENLEEWLGKTVTTDATRKETTWIKADPTFEGLQQTLIEPEHRVRIQPSKPDMKEPYKVISSVHFEGGGFPETTVLNPNLVSIIGARSSGKSSLLAYIAHAVDPEYTIAQQIACGMMKEGKAGPAAALTWEDVSDVNCTVKWADPAVVEGKVIYIPQNSLFSVSERPEEITEKIQPVLYRMDPTLQVAHQRMHAEIKASQAQIYEAVNDWFRLADQIVSARNELRGLGDAAAISSTRDELAARIARLREASALTPEDADAYEQLVERLGAISSRLEAIRLETAQTAPYLTNDGGVYAAPGVAVEVRLTPRVTDFPQTLAGHIDRLSTEAAAPLASSIAKAIVDYQYALDAESAALNDESRTLREANADLIARNQANTELEEAITSHKHQEELLSDIASKQQAMNTLRADQEHRVAQIQQHQAAVTAHIALFIAHFQSTEHVLDDMAFGVESLVTEEALESVSLGFNRQENTAYFDRSSALVKMDAVLSDPATFLASLHSRKQKVRVGSTISDVAGKILSVTPDVRFIATLDGDRIGGFERSSMTPGKQALFALTLLLNESEEAWPLLIDQPEDDLDSRSIFEIIVPYLVARKRDRQILMVSHDANLVVGADSEQVLIANRHANDRQNRGGQAFAYLSGSLEHSAPENDSAYVLESCGVREHACKILDGGEHAFQKRRDKYKI